MERKQSILSKVNKVISGFQARIKSGRRCQVGTQTGDKRVLADFRTIPLAIAPPMPKKKKKEEEEEEEEEVEEEEERI
ncbi:hypothetical protein PoB_002167100 [Plakobranchus ocellatus]|uniref:Uncharacterized protein n=1 Tax=Plakobranchus ocellatus TaxID=259542 RepID=A0AAV3Z780_9GAST|nr:hypothetical protein PoB_002167100 [Plakobranchus ocellatus]